MTPYVFNFTSIKNKRVKAIRGENILDLTEPVFDFTKPVSMREPIVVGDKFNARPDLIAKILYGSEDYTDILLMFNGISNPLTVQSGDVLLVPNLNEILNNAKDYTKSDDSKNQAAESLNKKISQKDKDRIQNLIKKNGGDVATLLLSPNMSDGRPAVLPDNGRIILGANVSDTRCKDKLSDTQTLTEKIRKAVKDKIKQNIASRTTSPLTGNANPSLNQATVMANNVVASSAVSNQNTLRFQ